MQNNQTFDQKLVTILKDKLGLEDQELNLQDNLETDLNIGELEKADLFASLEKELNFSIEDKSRLVNVKTLEDLIHLVEENSHEF
ncbi:hypothetical protein HY407_04855 [Candidatus Gottesmanbacteria bacterium]|nr:hypothetical protein [Candidatus Gottesmanbacteria bacterium]